MHIAGRNLNWYNINGEQFGNITTAKGYIILMLIFPSALGKNIWMCKITRLYIATLFIITTSQMTMNRELVIYIILYSHSWILVVTKKQG